MSKLLKLADRVEALSGPDREVDALIRCAVFAAKDAFVEQSKINGAWCVYEVGYGGKPRSWEPRNLTHLQRTGEFTSSLDAAMTLVPEGWRLSGLEEIWRTRRNRAQLSPRPSEKMLASFDAGRTVGWETCDCLSAATPALALCAAALRARHAVEGPTAVMKDVINGSI